MLENKELNKELDKVLESNAPKPDKGYAMFMVIIIALSLISLGMIVTAFSFSIKGNTTAEDEHIIKEYEIRKENSRADYEASRTRIQRLNTAIADEIDKLEEYEIIAHETEKELKDFQDRIETLSKNYKGTELIAGCVGGASIIFNIIEAVDSVIKYFERSSLQVELEKENAGFKKVVAPIHDLQFRILDYVISVVSHFKTVRRIQYETRVDGVNSTLLKQSMCSARAGSTTIFTTSTGHKFGFYQSSNWPCQEEVVKDSRAFTFSLDKNGYARVKSGYTSIRDRNDTMINIGDSEILVYENMKGKLFPGSSYDIPLPFDPNTFYAPETDVTLTNIEIYQTAVYG